MSLRLKDYNWKNKDYQCGIAQRRRAQGQMGGKTFPNEELAEWAKSPGFSSEPAGEQLGMFGDNEPV